MKILNFLVKVLKLNNYFDLKLRIKNPCSELVHEMKTFLIFFIIIHTAILVDDHIQVFK